MLGIHSGSSIERIIRNAVFAGLIITFAGWYLWDGYVGYPRKNLDALSRSLGLPEVPAAELVTGLTEQQGVALAEELRIGAPVEEVYPRLAEPAIEREGLALYLGPGGFLTVETERGRLTRAYWTDAPHTESDLRWQKRIGYALSVAGLIAVVHFVRILTVRVSLTDAGLKITGKPLIPFEAFTALHYRQDGGADTASIEYTVAGRPGVVELDSYLVRELPAIVEQLRSRMDQRDESSIPLRKSPDESV